MSLSDQCRHEFSAASRTKGEKIFQAEQVLMKEGDGKCFLAHVKDLITVNGVGAIPTKPTYRVLISVEFLEDDGFLEVSCDCPASRREATCEHVWSALLEMELLLQFANIVPPENIPIDVFVQYNLKLGKNKQPLLWPSGNGRRMQLHAQGLEDVDQEEAGGDDSPGIRQMQVSAPDDRSGERPGGRSSWELKLRWMSDIVHQYGRQLAVVDEKAQPVDQEVWYVLDVASSLNEGGLVIHFYQRARRRDGQWGKVKNLRVDGDRIAEFPRSSDRDLLNLLLDKGKEGSDYALPYYRPNRWHESAIVRPALYEVALTKACATGRFQWTLDAELPMEEALPLTWDTEGPWRLELDLSEHRERDVFRLNGVFARGEVKLPIESPVMVLAPNWLIFPDRISRLENPSHFGWISVLRRGGYLEIPQSQIRSFIEQLTGVDHLPELSLPENLEIQRIEGEPRPRLSVKDGKDSSTLLATLEFQYEEHVIAARDPRSALVEEASNCLLMRNRSAEQRWKTQLFQLGFVRPVEDHRSEYDVQFPTRELTKLVHHLVAAGWRVEARGKLFRSAGSFNIQVQSNVNWFELEGAVDFDGIDVPLPRLLAAVRTKERYIRLDDGTHGMIPEEWLKRYSFMAELAESEEGKLRFTRSQALLLDALLAEHQPQVDQQFAEFRQKLRDFQGIQPAEPPAEFVGVLRPYQLEGLGWLKFLRDVQLGGCLADDMGLGKTIQVLAMLELRRIDCEAQGELRRPSLVVVPKSLVFNWLDEAAKFTPQLKVLNHTGLERANWVGELGQFDLIVTTYGTLRRDIVELREVEFDYAILDEAQAIKNAQSQAAKATRLLKAQHRLAMTGTPVENHLGELWSLFEFLNPGILGRATVFQRVARRGSHDAEDIARLAQGLRPFFLRRTKEQVLKDLPEKSEQTLFCEMSPSERSQYDELREYYRKEILGHVANKGMAKSKIHVLEALLRLRQAACHPGLLNPSHAGKLSAKLETLLEQLEEIVAEGHKALVFSQFTSLLAIVRKHLDKRKIRYQYLDGQTRDRRTCVEEFQTRSEFPVFLISLKAGGHGLNLTAADYVFILDPWWNPAVEAQAVDRAHRIGQERHVFAYRLICRDTVEEKILELQRQKLDLADAILSENNSVLQNLSMEDLDLLLS